MKTFHVALSVRGTLHQGDKELRRLLPHISKADGSKVNTIGELREVFLQMIAEGIEMIPCSPKCDNFDPKHGCMGHEQEAPHANP